MAYGLLKESDIYPIIKAVCDCLGYGVNRAADELILETIGAETNFGNTIDLSKYAGMGLTQFDRLPFQDVKDRCSAIDKERIYGAFNINIELVQWEHLRYNPLLAIIFTRLKYKKIPEEIPDNLKGRSKYWKQHYNSEAGKGTIDHYVYATTMHKRTQYATA